MVATPRLSGEIQFEKAQELPVRLDARTAPCSTGGAEPSLERKLANLEEESEIENRLAALKKKIGGA